MSEKMGQFCQKTYLYTDHNKKINLYWHVGGKNKYKSQKTAFFLVEDNLYMSEDSLTVKYTDTSYH